MMNLYLVMSLPFVPSDEDSVDARFFFYFNRGHTNLNAFAQAASQAGLLLGSSFLGPLSFEKFQTQEI